MTFQIPRAEDFLCELKMMLQSLLMMQRNAEDVVSNKPNRRVLEVYV